jgi:mannosyltransferase
MGVSWRRVHTRLLVACTILVAAFAVRLWRLTDSPLWYDETFVLYHAEQGPAKAVVGLLALDNVLPLHGLVLSLWVAVAGQLEFAVRFSSVLAGTLAVALVGRWASEMTGGRSSWGPMVAIAASPVYVFYSQETRYPALSCALAAVFGLQSWRLMAGRGSRLAYLAAGVSMLLAHPYAGLLWVVMLALGVVAWVRRRDEFPASRWWTSNGLLAVVALPLALWMIWRAGIDATALTRSGWDMPRWLPVQYGVGEYLGQPWSWVFPAIVAVSIVMGLVCLAERRRWLVMGFILLGLSVPIGILLVASRESGKWSPRYLLFSWGLALLIAAGLGWDLLRRRWRVLGVILAAAYVSIAVPAIDLQAGGETALVLRDDTRPRPDFRSLAAYIEEHEQAGDAILVVGGHVAHTLDYYYEGTLPVLGLPDSLVLDTRHPLDLFALQDLERLAAGADRLWLVLWQYNLVDPSGIIRLTLSEACSPSGVGSSFLNVGLLAFELTGCRPLDAEVDPPIHVGADFGGMVLVGYELVREPERLVVDLWWEATGGSRGAYITFVHLVAPSGALVSQYDWPPGGEYPTSYWESGMRMRARHPLPLQPDETCCGCVLRVGLYGSSGRLLLPSGEDAVEIPLLLDGSD